MSESSRRILPSRSTRGKKPSLDAQQELQDDEALQTLFNRYLQKSAATPDPLRLFKENCSLNIKKYQYVRGVHYLIDIEEELESTRLENSSYVNNPYITSKSEQQTMDQSAKVLIRNEYTDQAQILVGKTKINPLINLKYIGLPNTNKAEFRNAGDTKKTKNICQSYCFEYEDKRYANERKRYTFKIMAKKIEKLLSNFQNEQSKNLLKCLLQQMMRFSILNQDQTIKTLIQQINEHTLNDNENSCQEDNIIELLKNLVQKMNKLAKAEQWISEINYKRFGAQECLFLVSSINQRFFDFATAYMQSIHSENLLYSACNFDFYPRSDISQQEYLQYKLKRSNLINYLSKNFLQSYRLTQPARMYLFPNRVFDFCCNEARTLADFLIGSKLLQESEAVYFIGKAAFKQLFQRQLRWSPPQNKKITPQTLIKGICTKIQIFLEANKKSNPTIDHTPINHQKIIPFLDQFVSESNSNLDLKYFLNVSYSAITSLNILLIAAYEKLCHALCILSRLELDNNCLDLLVNPDYSKYWDIIAQRTGQPASISAKYMLNIICETLNGNISETVIQGLQIKWAHVNGLGIIMMQPLKNQYDQDNLNPQAAEIQPEVNSSQSHSLNNDQSLENSNQQEFKFKDSTKKVKL